MQRTLVLLKPDCVQRRLSGRIIARFEDKGFNIIALKMIRVSAELARQHYAEHVEKTVLSGPRSVHYRGTGAGYDHRRA